MAYSMEIERRFFIDGRLDKPWRNSSVSSSIKQYYLRFENFSILSKFLYYQEVKLAKLSDEEVKIITNKKKGKKQVQIHSYLLDHQLFHQIIHSRSNCVSDYSLSRVF